jgi:hypothetical protein
MGSAQAGQTKPSDQRSFKTTAHQISSVRRVSGIRPQLARNRLDRPPLNEMSRAMENCPLSVTRNCPLLG